MDVRQAIEIDPDFEPQQRVRCNTWPCRPREDVVEAQCSPASDESTADNHVKPDNLGLNKKTSSRRNAWGNLSYADLITKAIQSSAEQRLTLSQIYDWMVQNVPYFKDKGDSTSSAGWKVCICLNSCGLRCPLSGPRRIFVLTVWRKAPTTCLQMSRYDVLLLILSFDCLQDVLIWGGGFDNKFI